MTLRLLTRISMDRRSVILLGCALVTLALLGLLIRQQEVPAGFQFRSQVTVRLSASGMEPRLPFDLRKLIDVQGVESAVRARMLVEGRPFIIRPGGASSSSITFDVFTANDWWFGKVEEALLEECKVQAGRAVPSSAINFRVEQVIPLAEKSRRLLDLLPWFARAKA